MSHFVNFQFEFTNDRFPEMLQYHMNNSRTLQPGKLPTGVHHHGLHRNYSTSSTVSTCRGSHWNYTPFIPPKHRENWRLLVKQASPIVDEVNLDKEENKDEREESEVEAEPIKEKFNWFKNWWAVQVVDNLHTDRPNKAKLLNKDIIVWKSHSGKWIAMDDECPHRMAPLSEGRIEADGNLLCSYHAWRFNESGKCVKIPHAESQKAHSVACSSPRSAVQTYPCKEYGAVLWVWPDDSVSAYADSELTGPPIEKEVAAYFERSYVQGGHPHFIRYVPYGYDVMLENTLDPSHYPVSHHGSSPGISRYNAKPIKGKLVSGFGEIPADIAIEYDSEFSGNLGHIEFRKPSVVIIGPQRSPDEKYYSGLLTTITPISPGKCLVIAAGTNSKLIDKQVLWTPIKCIFNLRLMDLAIHQFRNNILDGDNVFLHQVDLKVRTKGLDFKGRSNYYAVTDADVAVLAFRAWFEGEGDYGNAYGGYETPGINDRLTKEQILNRYEQHTKHCKLCTEALQDVNRVISVLKTMALVLAAGATVMLFKEFSLGASNALSIVKNVKLMASALVSVMFVFLAQILEKKVVHWFYFKEHSHPDMD
eukprot:g6528.t1